MLKSIVELPCGGYIELRPVFQPEVQVQGEEAGAGGVEGVETEPPDTTVGRCARWVEIRLHTKRI